MRLVWYRGGWCIYTGRGKRVSCRTTDRTEAERELAEYRRRVTERVETVGQIVEAYLEDRKGKATSKTMRFWWKNAEHHFGKLIPENITREVCREYSKSRKAANETIRHEIGIVRAAVRWKNRNTPANFELPPRSPSRDNHISRDEFHRLLEACAHKHLKLFVRLALATAARKTAILELTWDRVDFERNLVIFSKGEKNKKGRANVKMNSKLKEALLEAKESALTPYVIEYGAKKVGKIDKGFRAAVRIAGLENITPHDMRRTAAIWMAEKRVPMAEIASYLGHEDSRITEKYYARYSPDFLQGAAEALNE